MKGVQLSREQLWQLQVASCQLQVRILSAHTDTQDARFLSLLPAIVITASLLKSQRRGKKLGYVVVRSCSN